ncbi:hypothetical protein T439DRAFT_357386 [Meredithblackwellia eburnea MCA 4105]
MFGRSRQAQPQPDHGHGHGQAMVNTPQPSQHHHLRSAFDSPTPVKIHTRASSMPSNDNNNSQNKQSSKSLNHQRSKSWLTNFLRPNAEERAPMPCINRDPPPRPPRPPLLADSPTRTTTPSAPIPNTLRRKGKRSMGSLSEIPRPRPYEEFDISHSTQPIMKFPTVSTYTTRPPPRSTSTPPREMGLGIGTSKVHSGQALAEWSLELDKADESWRRRSQDLGSHPLASPPPRRRSHSQSHADRRRSSIIQVPAHPRRTSSQTFVPEVPIAPLRTPPRQVSLPVPAILESHTPLPSLVSVWDDFLAEAELTFDEGDSSILRSTAAPYTQPIGAPTSPPPRPTPKRPGWRTGDDVPESAATLNTSNTLKPPSVAPSPAGPDDSLDASSMSHCDSIFSLYNTFPSPPLAGASVFSSPILPLFSNRSSTAESDRQSIAERRSRTVPALKLSSSNSSTLSAYLARQQGQEDMHNGGPDRSYFSPVSASSEDGDSPKFHTLSDLPSPPIAVQVEDDKGNPAPLKGLALAASSFDPTYSSWRLSQLHKLGGKADAYLGESGGHLSVHAERLLRSKFSPYSTPSVAHDGSSSASSSQSAASSSPSPSPGDSPVVSCSESGSSSAASSTFNSPYQASSGSFETSPSSVGVSEAMTQTESKSKWAWDEWEELRRTMVGQHHDLGGDPSPVYRGEGEEVEELYYTRPLVVRKEGDVHRRRRQAVVIADASFDSDEDDADETVVAYGQAF